MDIYLLRHAHVDYAQAVDPRTVGLSPRGRAQAERLAEAAQGWGLQFLCVSTMLRAQETADVIQARIPSLLRWDLEELEEMNVDDLLDEPQALPSTTQWTAEQRMLGYERTWVRIMAAVARIGIYAQSHDIERVGIVSHGHTIKLLLLNWLGHDWRLADRLRFPVDFASSCRLTLNSEDETIVHWVNRTYDAGA